MPPTRLSSSSSQTSGWLVFQRHGKSRSEPLRHGRSVIGRDPAECEIVIEGDDGVSGRHAVVDLENGQFVVKDLGSLNKTYVNGELVGGRRTLRDGDVVRLGATDLVFKRAEL